MVLNYIWIAFFLIAFLIALVKLVFMGDFDVFPAMMNSTFETSKTAFEISLGLTGVLSLWLGIMKIGEKGGVVNVLARVLSPVFTKLFPDIPKGHPVTGSIFMNIAANMLGLDNAATPMGLKAMEQMQELNPKKDTATNPMIMFLVLNTSGLTLIPVSIMVYRVQLGASNPTDIFIPILLATFCSTLAGIVITSFYQRINLLNRTLLLTLGGMCALVAAIVWGFGQMDKEQMNVVSTSVANILLMGINSGSRNVLFTYIITSVYIYYLFSKFYSSKIKKPKQATSISFKSVTSQIILSIETRPKMCDSPHFKPCLKYTFPTFESERGTPSP